MVDGCNVHRKTEGDMGGAPGVSYIEKSGRRTGWMNVKKYWRLFSVPLSGVWFLVSDF